MAEGWIIMTKFILCEIEGKEKKKFVISERFEKGFGENLMT